MTRRLADYIANGKPKVAMLTDDSGYGEQGREALREAFTSTRSRSCPTR